MRGRTLSGIAVAIVSLMFCGGGSIDGSCVRTMNSSVDDIRFVYSDNRRLYVELLDNEFDLLQQLMQNEQLQLPNKPLEDPLPTNIERTILKRAHLVSGMKYTVYFPASDTTKTFVLTGVRIYPGLGAKGFIATLGQTGDACLACTDSWSRPVALAVQGPRFVERRHLDVAELTDEERTCIKDSIPLLASEDCSVLSYAAFYFSCQREKAAVVVVERKRDRHKLMSCLVKFDSAWRLVPIESRSGEKEVLLDLSLSTELLLINWDLFILPDLNADGGNEILFSSQGISILLSPCVAKEDGRQKTYRLREIHRAGI